MRCEMRAADRAAPLGVERGDVRAGQARHDQRSPASRRPEHVLHRGFEDRRRAGDRPLSTADDLDVAARATRPARLPSGEPNLAGDWAQEQYLIARPPTGRGGLVPKSQVAAVEAGTRERRGPCRTTAGASVPWTLTAAGQAASDVLKGVAPQDNLRARCEITSILFRLGVRRADQPDRTNEGRDHDRIQPRHHARRVRMNASIPGVDQADPRRRFDRELGRATRSWSTPSVSRRGASPAPCRAATSCTSSSASRSTRRRSRSKRDYVADDSVYFTDQYKGSDVVMPADAPYAADRCQDLTYKDYSKEQQKK